MTKFICTLLLALSAITVTAQDRDMLSVNYSTSKLTYNDTTAHNKQLEVKMRYPLLVRNKQMLMAGVTYKNFSLDKFPGEFVSPLHAVSLQLVWFIKLNDRNSLSFFTQGGLFSDMKDINGKDYRYSIGIRYRVKHSEKLATGWGLAYARQFFGNQLIPFIDIDYKPNDKWSISGQFPIKPKVLYHFNEKLAAGLEISGEGNSYRLSEKENQSRFLQYNQWTVLAKLEYRFTKSWQLFAGIGSNFRQSYRLYNDASSVPWTIITIPIGKRDEPIQKIDSKGYNFQLGLSFSPF